MRTFNCWISYVTIWTDFQSLDIIRFSIAGYHRLQYEWRRLKLTPLYNEIALLWVYCKLLYNDIVNVKLRTVLLDKGQALLASLSQTITRSNRHDSKQIQSKSSRVFFWRISNTRHCHNKQIQSTETKLQCYIDADTDHMLTLILTLNESHGNCCENISGCHYLESLR